MRSSVAGASGGLCNLIYCMGENDKACRMVMTFSRTWCRYRHPQVKVYLHSASATSDLLSFSAVRSLKHLMTGCEDPKGLSIAAKEKFNRDLTEVVGGYFQNIPLILSSSRE